MSDIDEAHIEVLQTIRDGVEAVSRDPAIIEMRRQAYYLDRVRALDAAIQALERQRELSHMLERDRTAVCRAVNALRGTIHSYEWLRLGRGSYEYDDDRWRDEFSRAYEEIESQIDGLKEVYANWEGCPKTRREVKEAREPLERQRVPEGWKLVPERAPTQEMQQEYFRVIDQNMPRVQSDPKFGRYASHTEAYRAEIAAAPEADTAKGPHPSHDLRSSDASTFDVVCKVCNRTDRVPGGWGDLLLPCPGARR